MVRTPDSDREGVIPRKGIYLLPNLLTSACLFSGFYAIIAAIKGDHQSAAVAILVAAIFDGLDGRVARLTRTTSRFGVEYDSLSDLVAFGVAPGILAYMWGLQDYGRLGWLAAFLYVATTALRLARFNVLSQSGHVGTKSYFLGLPCPSAAGVVATGVLISQHFGAYGPVRHIAVITMVYCLSFLMVSNVRFASFKEMRWFQQHPFSGMVVLILSIMVIATEPSVTLFVLLMSYVLSGPVSLFVRSLRSRPLPSGVGEGGEKEFSARLRGRRKNE
jgi:CDP-diacylglycerol--serine O-phosphatidyltransferase